MRLLVVSSVFLIAMAGCAAPADTAPMAEQPSDDVPVAVNNLAGTIEPDDLVAPTFRLLGAVAEGGKVYSMGEPGVYGDLDGAVYIAFPGCDEGATILDGSCGHGQVFRSRDDGAHWERMNTASGGRLTEDGPAANGDADVAVDSAGNIYVSNLGSGIQFHTYWAENQTWEYMANIVPHDEDGTLRESADRQWLAAAGPGHVINAWMRTAPERDVEINTTFDGGRTWTGSTYFGDGIGWLGTPQFAVDGMHAYIPYTQPTGVTTPAGGILGNDQTFEMHVIRTTDGGRSWDDIATGLTWSTTSTSLHWSGGYMAPTLDVTGDGTVVVAMAVDAVNGILDVANVGTRIIYAISHDNGTSWADTGSFSGGLPGGINGPTDAANVIFPWITGGAGDRWAITYLHAPGVVQSDVAGTVWSLEARVFDDDNGTMRSVRTVIDDDVHQGPVCARGGACAFPVDRTLLDYFESDMTADGRLIVAYPADSYVGSQRSIQVRFAIQDGGSPLLARA